MYYQSYWRNKFMNTKLELTWFNKNEPFIIEPRILMENKDLSYSFYSKNLIKDDGIYNNILIHGDNLLALKTLQSKYNGKVKCIYIDPPYNTGSAFEFYDDNLEHSTWLNLMKPRLEILKKLLCDSGTILIQIDYNEQAYLKVLCDEIFGRKNFITMITCKVKAPSGIASGANAFFDCSEYILVYAKDKTMFKFNPLKVDSVAIDENAKKVTNVYNQLIKKWNNNFKPFSNFEDIEIKELDYDDFCVETIPTKDRTSLTYYENYTNIFRTAAISGGRDKKVLSYLNELPDYDKNKIYSYSYVATQGKFKGKKITNYIYKNNNILFLKDFVRVDDSKKKVYKQDIITNIFYNDWWQGLTNEGGVTFKNGQKPEKLIYTLFNVLTNEGDLVMDSFLGSGTTIAVAHKMHRRWIGIEMGEQAYSLCKTRIDNVINGLDKTGVTNESNWQGGGGYKFYELAPTLIKVDDFGQEIINPAYNAEMLAAAVALHEGYKYDPNPNCFFKQSNNGNSSYLFVTTNHVDSKLINNIKLNLKDGEFLLIVCKSYDPSCNDAKNIIIKKIPQSLLNKCDFGVDNYNFNIINPPIYEDECDEDDTE